MKIWKIINRSVSIALFSLVVMLIGSLAPEIAFANGSKSPILEPNTFSTTRHVAPFDLFGYFYIKGKAPVGFTNIDFFDLGGDGEFGAGAKPPYYGQIRLKGRGMTSYKLLKPTVDGKNLSFETKKVAGISYKFEGTLTQTDFTDAQPGPDDVVLTGTLTKMKNGKSIGTAKLKFIWSVGD